MSAVQQQEEGVYVKTFGCSAPAVGCLFKFPLGCLAFVVGMAGMLFLLFPFVAERSLQEEMVRDFESSYLGTIDVGAVRWWWFDPLIADEVVLREQDGREVAQFTVHAPSRGDLFDFIWSSDGDHLPTLHLALDAQVRVDANGDTNVARALTPNPKRPEKPGFDVNLSGGGITINETRAGEASRIDVGLRVALDVTSLTWTDERDLGFELVDATGEIDVPRAGELTITLIGGIAGSAPSRFELVWATADRDVLFDDEVALAPSLTLNGTSWPTDRVEHLLGLAPGTLAALGEVVPGFSAHAYRDDDEGLALTVEFTVGEERWELDGRLVDLFPRLGPLARSN